jgi:hypothetical protein
MNHLQQLEQQKQAVLERIQTRRVEYRYRFVPRENVMQEGDPVSYDNVFPRSITFKLLSRHPYFLLGAAAALLFAGPRKSLIAAATSAAVAALKRYGVDHFFHSTR